MNLADASAATPKLEPMQVSAYPNLAAAEAAWRRLESAGSGTPYQGFDFCKAWFDTIGKAEGAEPLIVHISDPARGLELIWPLAVSRLAGCRIARFAGGKHSNYNLPLGTLSKVGGAELHQLLLHAAKGAGIDHMALSNQPRIWAGATHPLATVAHTASPSSAWSADLLADADAMAARIMSGESLKKLRKKERKLGELGPVTYTTATTQKDVDAALEAFLIHKKQRFAAMGVPNPFADDATIEFLKRILATSTAGAPAQFHILKVGDTVAALFAGMICNGRYSGMTTSFDSSPAISKYSPGDMLLLNMMRTMGADGLTAFDLGIGEAAYKAGYCPHEDQLFDTCIKVSTKGILLCSVLKMLTLAKRRIKANPRLLAFARKFQRG